MADPDFQIRGGGRGGGRSSRPGNKSGEPVVSILVEK